MVHFVLVATFHSLEANSTSSPGSKVISLGLCTAGSTFVNRNTVELGRDRNTLESIIPAVLLYHLFSFASRSFPILSRADLDGNAKWMGDKETSKRD